MKWTKHGSVMNSVLHDAYRERAFTDLQLRCGGEVFFVHRSAAFAKVELETVLHSAVIIFQSKSYF